MKRIVSFVLALLLLAALAVAVSAAGEGEETLAEAGNLFDNLTAFVDTHGAELLSLMTLVTSVALALTYRRRVIPTLIGGLGKIADTAAGAQTRAEETGERAENAVRSLSECVTPAVAAFGKVTESVAEMEEQVAQMLTRLRESEEERAVIRAYLAGVGELLYGIFSSANLPQYAKEELGRTYSDLLATVGGGNRDTANQTPAV